MKQKFIDLFKETLEIEDREIAMSDIFRDYDEWDSLGLLSVIAMIDEEYDLIIESVTFQELLSVSDIYEHVNQNKSV
jgi:acyl carrier protein